MLTRMFIPELVVLLAIFIFRAFEIEAAVQPKLETAINSQSTTPQMPMRSLRLPNTTFPLHYYLHISSNIHLKDLAYTGNVTIDIEIRESTNEIVLHAKNLTEFVINVYELSTGEIVDDLTYSFDKRASFLIIHPKLNYQAFEAGQRFRVEILFTAEMYTKTNGIYWLTYNDVNNQTVYLAATQFEPTSARLAFPCYDEPSYKANFSLRITHGSDYTAIANMEAQHVEKHNDADLQLTTTTFHTTPPISTYLIAFVISNFENISETYRGVTQRLFTHPGSADKGYEALQTAVRTVATLEDYFQINYPLAKLDHIALQKNYGAAMENWGLITYKDECLLDRNSDDLHKQLKDILTQNHEIAHQWFGNLVSPEWWTYAWLNEGFATYFGYIVTDLIYPEYKAMDFFLTDIAERAYSFGYITMRSMTYYVEKEADILSIFDIITYQRAACIIKMFHHAFNGQTFVCAITNYLRENQYKTANEVDLFRAVQHAVREDPNLMDLEWGQSVHDIMHSWTHSEWIPIVSIIRNYNNNTITIRQRSKEVIPREHWWIPLNFATASSPDFERTNVVYFMPAIPEITISVEKLGLRLAPDDWLIANVQQTGFYHVVYDTENLRRLAKVLQRNYTTIHRLNRAAIFQDLRPFIESNDIQSVDVIFELLKYLRNEKDLIPWNQVADTIEFLDRNLYGTHSHKLYKEFMRGLTAPIFGDLFMNASSTAKRRTNTQLLVQQKIMDMACTADLEECLTYTRRLAHEYVFRHKSIEMMSDYYSLHDSILCLGLKYLTDHEFDGIMNILSEADRNTLYYDDILYSLRCTQSPAHLRQYLNLLLGANSTHNIMNDSDSMMYLFYLYKANLAARPVMWRFFERNYKLLCRSPFFAENFNRMAEYIPKQQLPRFKSLRRDIIQELKTLGNDAGDTLIAEDSFRLGKKVQMSEIFKQKFADDIYNWLKHEQEREPSIHVAAVLNAHNRGYRFGSFIQSAKLILRKLLSLSIIPSFQLATHQLGP